MKILKFIKKLLKRSHRSRSNTLPRHLQKIDDEMRQASQIPDEDWIKRIG